MDKLPPQSNQKAPPELSTAAPVNNPFHAGEKDLDYMSDVKASLLAKHTPVARLFITVLVLFFTVLFIWAALCSLDESTMAIGKVIPSSEVKVIQSLDGGIVDKILIKEGDEVKTNQILIQLDDTRYISQFRQASAKQFALMASVARLTAEVSNENKITFPKEVLKHNPDLVERETQLFLSRRNALLATLNPLEQNYALALHELRLTEPMVQQGLVSQVDLLKLQREVNQLRGELDAKKQKFYEEAETDLNKNKSELAGLTEAIVADEDRVNKTTIRSPVNGTVKSLYETTIGQVVKPGENMLEIVPSEDRLLIQARVQPDDIGFIKVGQPATVKIATYDYSIYGGLDGKVEYISADSLTDPKEGAYYEVTIGTKKKFIDYHGQHLPIKVGMTTTVNIKTGKKSVLTYILKPLLKARYGALQER